GGDWGHGGCRCNEMMRLQVRLDSAIVGTPPKQKPSYSANSRQLFPAQHVHDSIPADAALQDDGATGSRFNSADAHSSLRHLNLSFRTRSAASDCVAGTKTANRPSLATYKGSSRRISQAPCTISFTGIRDCSSLMQTLRSDAIPPRVRSRRQWISIPTF